MLVVFALDFFVVCLLNLTPICFKHFMFVMFKFVGFGVLQLRHMIRLKLPDFLMVFTFCLIILILFLFWHLFSFSTILSYADIFFLVVVRYQYFGFEFFTHILLVFVNTTF